MPQPDLLVAGAGMAGLVAAAQARQRGARVELREKLGSPGGSMRLSSAGIWRHRDADSFARECPGGDVSMQRAVIERLDSDVEWLRALGAEVTGGTGNPRTIGSRFHPKQLTDVLLKAAGDPILDSPVAEHTGNPPLILATGGFPASRELVRKHVTPMADDVMLRAAPGATGDGLRIGLTAGADTTAELGEAYGRNMPAPPARVPPSAFVSLSQLYASTAEVRNADGERFESRTWSQIDAFQWTARQPGARAWMRVPIERLGERVGGRTVESMVEAAIAAGAPARRNRDSVTVETVAGISTTLGGLRADTNGRVAAGVFAAGGDVGGIATGGYASGLAAALVFGRIAADAALGIG